jgi:hypothetical protein
MTVAVNVEDIVASAVAAVTPIIKKDGANISQFAKSQLKLMRDQAIMISEGVLAGEFEGPRKKLLKHHLKMLALIGENFLAALAGISLVTVEKVWNTLVDVVWGALDKAVGFALPRP